MEILEKAYDYIDYTLEELAKLEDKCVSLLYFFKLFSPAGELAQQILIEHSFIDVEKDRSGAVVGITDRGRTVVQMGGIRNYLNYLDHHPVTRHKKIKALGKVLKWSAYVAASAIVLSYVIWKTTNHKPATIDYKPLLV
jgi:hypothetical protein